MLYIYEHNIWLQVENKNEKLFLVHTHAINWMASSQTKFQVTDGSNTLHA